uniref:Uncharacterized protein LOC111114903 n=1 Tax=Crassostrea virginica TaxID=6565 RepID=A0A8B8C0Q9_CRAVI|nr:uncharacterized protein LOC111114903 [Crassostrea virginica]
MKQDIEEHLQSGDFGNMPNEEVSDGENSGHEISTPVVSEESEMETGSSNMIEPSSSTTISSLYELPLTEENTDVEVESIQTEEDHSSPGYTLTWDNVGKMTKACHQNTQRQNKMMLWALSFCAENRIYTTGFTSEEVVKAVDIPIEKFLPMKDDLQEVRNRMEIIVMHIIQQNVPFFASSKVVTHIRHKYWRESSKKSNVINLGVCQENPSTAAGTIQILENLHQYVPTHEDRVHQILCFGDGLSCERHNDAHMSRSNGETMIDRLQGLQPQVQEFHKRMLLMQDVMNTFFHGSSAAEKGTLFHLKNVFGHRSVKKDVGETFNHAADFLKFVTHGYVLLATLEVCGMATLDDQPEGTSADTDIDLYIREVSRKVVELVWQSPDTQQIIQASDGDQSDYIYCHCKTDLGDEAPMIDCSGINCPGNNRFHLECIGMEEDDVPDEDFYCSEECQKRRIYRYCTCHEDLGEFEPMVACDNKNCRLEWFHYKCVGLENAPAGKWYCSDACKRTYSKKKSSSKETLKEDGTFNYISSLTYMGLMDLVRQNAVRENDGDAMMSHWKLDLLHFHNYHHPKYVLLGHRLLAGVSGWLPKRLAMDSQWNRTVNLAGGPGRNLPGDLVNEFLNKVFKESLKDAGGNLSEETIYRHSQLAGRMGKMIDKAYLPESARDFIKHTAVSMTKDLQLFVKLLHTERFFVKSPGRSFKSYPDFHFSVASKFPQKFKQKIVQLSKRLDKIRRCTTLEQT